MRDDHELGHMQELGKHRDKPPDIGFVEGRIDFVENTEGAGAEFEDRHDQRNCRQCLLAAAEQGVGKGGFAGRGGNNLHPGLRHILALLQD